MKMMSNSYPPYAVIEKAVGETPLVALEKYRAEASLPPDLPLAYAGRLDPMASGKLLVLIGDTCKEQEKYHDLDKEYEFEVLLNITSDSGDVLGLITEHKPTEEKKSDQEILTQILHDLTGTITFPYPIYSSKTIKGIPLHTWAVTGRLNEIEIPTRTSNVYELELLETKTLSRKQVVEEALAKINSLPKVTDPRKSLGNDFRREEVLSAWAKVAEGNPNDEFTILKLRCLCSSGTYMRTLAEEIGKRYQNGGLAFSIHRTKIGHLM